MAQTRNLAHASLKTAVFLSRQKYMHWKMVATATAFCWIGHQGRYFIGEYSLGRGFLDQTETYRPRVKFVNLWLSEAALRVVHKLSSRSIPGDYNKRDPEREDWPCRVMLPILPIQSISGSRLL